MKYLQSNTICKQVLYQVLLKHLIKFHLHSIDVIYKSF